MYISNSALTFYRGRVGLFALLKALGVQRGDDVCAQAFTCVAVPEGIMAVGARPVFVDIEKSGYNMDADNLESKLTERTKAVVVQHTFGIPASLGRILRIAEDRGIPVIEDCCHSILSRYDGRTVGGFGVGAFFSYEWGKPVVLGLGGSLQVSDRCLQTKLEAFCSRLEYPNWVRSAKVLVQWLAFQALLTPARYWFVKDAFRKLSSLGVAEGNYNPVAGDRPAKDFELRMIRFVERRWRRSKDALAEEHAEHSRAVVAQYQKTISNPEVVHPLVPAGAEVIYARYPLLVSNKRRLLEVARARKVEVADWYNTPVHPLRGAELGLVQYTADSCPEAERRAAMVVSLPTYRKVSPSDIERCAALLSEFRP